MPEYEYQNCRFTKDGKPFFVIASDYQYYRDRREVWEDRLTKLKELGVNVITFYTPWRHHLQINNGQIEYDFTGVTKDSRDLVTFLQMVERVGLLMVFKPGPFVHSELNVGGLPDLVTPTFNPNISGMRRYDDSPVRWCYDNAILPAPLGTTYDDLVKGWLSAVSPLVAPYAKPGGPLVAIQLNDETIFCCSNDPPWRLGYESSSMQFYHGLLQDRYGDIDNYNQSHGTEHTAFDFVHGPQPLLDRKGDLVRREGGADSGDMVTHCPQRQEDLLSYIDWAEHQWRLRRDVYVRYKDYVNIEVPYLTNYAGVTSPIEQNIPDHDEDEAEYFHPKMAKTYADWWFAMNRVDQDAADGSYEYGMISWLGVAAYDEDVFDRYVNTARRRRGINMEENWGFAAFYDERSKYPIVPVFQTLVSLAAGATGYDIYTGTSTDYWDDTLDRVTKKQSPTFPSDAPIDAQGNPGLLYDAAAMLNRWFNENGAALLECEPQPEVAYLLYAPYAAVASWVPDEDCWELADHDLPRCGYEALEPWSSSLQRAGYSPVMRELEEAPVEWMLQCQTVAMQMAFFMGRMEQEKLVAFIEQGGRLFVSGELPTVDLDWKPCTLLKDAVERAAQNGTQVTYRRENLFADARFADRLAESQILPRVTCSDQFRVLVHYNTEAGNTEAGNTEAGNTEGTGEQERFIFFFQMAESASNQAWLELDGERIEMQLGSKTCGVLRITDGKITAHFVKGQNEIAKTVSDIRIQYGEQTIEGQGDFASTE
jgi:beta-galactosidase